MDLQHIRSLAEAALHEIRLTVESRWDESLGIDEKRWTSKDALKKKLFRPKGYKVDFETDDEKVFVRKGSRLVARIEYAGARYRVIPTKSPAFSGDLSKVNSFMKNLNESFMDGFTKDEYLKLHGKDQEWIDDFANFYVTIEGQREKKSFVPAKLGFSGGRKEHDRFVSYLDKTYGEGWKLVDVG